MGSAQFDTNDGQLIQTIKESVAVEKFTPEKGEMFSRKLYHPDDKPLVPKLEIASLSGVVDYIKHGVDAEARLNDAFIHVLSPTEVQVICQVKGREDRRWLPLRSLVTPVDSELLNEDFVSQADAIIELQSCFEPSETRAELIRILGTISREDGINQEDDGATQSVTLRSGVKAGEAKIANPYVLKPFRTFPDIEQPESPFIVRLDGAMRVGVFCADGGKWANAARKSIKEFLVKELGPDIPVLA